MFSLPTTPNTSNPSPPPAAPSTTSASTSNPLISAEKTHGIAIDEPTVRFLRLSSLLELDVLLV